MNALRKIDTNLAGQKLGKKGRETRERILLAAREQIEAGGEEGFSLSAVARRADLRMASIYNYFSDLTELFLAVLEPVAAEAEGAYISLLREPWPDAELAVKSSEFVNAFYAFWHRNTRVLHLRNALADQHDTRVLLQRIDMARDCVRLLGQQLGGLHDSVTGPQYDLASVLYTGLERVVTISTDEQLKAHYPANIKPRFEGGTIRQQAALIALAMADMRQQTRVASAA